MTFVCGYIQFDRILCRLSCYYYLHFRYFFLFNYAFFTFLEMVRTLNVSTKTLSCSYGQRFKSAFSNNPLIPKCRSATCKGVAFVVPNFHPSCSISYVPGALGNECTVHRAAGIRRSGGFVFCLYETKPEAMVHVSVD